MTSNWSCLKSAIILNRMSQRGGYRRQQMGFERRKETAVPLHIPMLPLATGCTASPPPPCHRIPSDVLLQQT
jgi:hypothetical protein